MEAAPAPSGGGWRRIEHRPDIKQGSPGAGEEEWCRVGDEAQRAGSRVDWKAWRDGGDGDGGSSAGLQEIEQGSLGAGEGESSHVGDEAQRAGSLVDWKGWRDGGGGWRRWLGLRAGWPK